MTNSTRPAPSPPRRLALASGWLTNAVASLIVAQVASFPDTPGMDVWASVFYALCGLSMALCGFQLYAARKALRPEEFE